MSTAQALLEKGHRDAEIASQTMVRVGQQREAQAATLFHRYAAGHPALVTQLNDLDRRRREKAAELQETQHQATAHAALSPAAGADIDAHDQRGGILHARAARLQRELAQLDQEIGAAQTALEAQVRQDMGRAAQAGKMRYNAIAAEGRKQYQALLQQAEVLNQQLQAQLAPIHQEIVVLSQFVAVNIAFVEQTGLLHID